MSDTQDWKRLLRPGTTCWRMTTAERVGVLLETDRYFRALRNAAEQARRSLFILGWDFDRRERIGREDDAPTFERFLCDLLERRSDLHVWLLSWDYAFVYAGEREWFQEYRLRYLTHERLHVHFDDAHPTGGSQHQKIVVVDDRVAFSGGIDLSRWRWDTCEHRPHDRRRTDPDGNAYPPFHDGMLVVDGETAGALGELARDRWRESGAEDQPPGPDDIENDPWPADVTPTWRSIRLAIARTWPAFGNREPVREVERLFLESVACARDYIYIENQYFTSRALTDALAERLEEADGPEVVLVLPLRTGGWLEQVTMDALRAFRLRRLHEADRHDRFRVFFPHQPGLDDGDCIGLHAKFMVADDRFFRLGSANTSNRSMGLDSECDLALLDEAGDGVRGLLHHLLAEHLDTEASAVADARATGKRLVPTIDGLRSDEGRSLRPLEPDREATDLDLSGEEDLVDPDEPINPGYLVSRAVPPDRQEEGHFRLWLFGGFIVALLALGVSWRFTPLGDWLTAERIADWLTLFDSTWVRFLTVLAVLALTTLVMVPLSALVVASALLLGPWLGFLCSMIGALISAAIAFFVGQVTGGRILERYGESRVHRLSRRLSDRGILAVAVLRLMPVAPYTIVNLVAGASHLTLGKFLIGSAVGLVPGVAALSWFSGSLWQAVTEPSAESLGVLAVVIAAIGVGVFLLRRLLRDS